MRVAGYLAPGLMLCSGEYGRSAANSSGLSDEPYSEAHAHPMVKRWKRSMSMTPTSGSAAPNKSGRSLSTAPTSRPVAAAGNRQCCLRRIFLGDQPVGGGDEVIEDLLLVQLCSRQVPLLAVLTAAAKIGDRIHSAHLHPDQPAHREPRRDADLEPAVPEEIRRIPSVQLHPFPEGEEHRHARAVLARVEDLPRFVEVRIKVDLRPAEHLAPPAGGLVPVDRAGLREAGERIEGLRVRTLAPEAADRADSRQDQLPERRAVQREYSDPALRVLQIRGDERVVDGADGDERIFCLGYDLLPLGALRPRDVDGDDPAPGSAQVRLEPEPRAVVVDERVFRVELHEQLDHGRAG